MSTGRASKSGHTLIELTVASAVLLVLMSSIFQIFVAAKRYQENCEAKIELQGNVLTALSKMSQELVESDRYAVQVSAANSCIIFSTPRGLDGRVSFDSAGRLLWKKTVLYYTQVSPEGIPTLYRKTIVVSPWLSDVPPPPPPVAVRDDGSIPARVVAKNIKNFVPKLNPDGTVGLLVQGEFKLYTRTYGVEVQGQVFPNN